MLTKEKVDQLLIDFYALKNQVNSRILEIADICRKHCKFAEWKPVENNNDVYFYFEEIISKNIETDVIYVDCLRRDHYTNDDGERESIYNIFIDKYGKDFELNNQIPTRWLWEDFEQELIDGLEKYKNKGADFYKDLLLEKQMLEFIKSKLTTDEAEYLTIDKKIRHLQQAIDRVS